ncbi:addiction module protein [candidate division CSSED10-310 bacterium]|uniref:Addiction module protein n=1 Tax=candidate division CSSED10-310 bacterium TaxID=2855610 RepID=A0ABV6YUN0_UNCC1
MESSLTKEIKKLSIAERILLVEELWNSILSDQEKLRLTSEQKDELDARLQDYQNSPQEGSSWDDVKGRVIDNK